MIMCKILSPIFEQVFAKLALLFVFASSDSFLNYLAFFGGLLNSKRTKTSLRPGASQEDVGLLSFA